jgi:hypothetical protein
VILLKNPRFDLRAGLANAVDPQIMLRQRKCHPQRFHSPENELA